MDQRILDISSSHAFLVAEQNGSVLGYAYGSQHRARAAYRKSVDVTVYVAEQARRSGIGSALYGELLPQLRKQGLHAAFAGIALPNPGSVALREKIGFTPIGVYREVGFKFGRWHDVGWWQMILA